MGFEEKSDEELLALYNREKDEQVLNALFLRYVDVGFRTAMRYMRNQSDAEDVLQLAFIQFLKNISSFREGAATIKPWLMKMIVNTSLNKLKEEKRRSRRQEKAASERFHSQQSKLEEPSDASDKEELKNKLHVYVESLPEKYKSPIWLVLYEGLSYPEAASILSLPEKTIRTQVSRGIERLRQIFLSFGSALSATVIMNALANTKLEAAPLTVVEKLGSKQLQLSSENISSYHFKSASSAKISAGIKLALFSLTVVAVATVVYFSGKGSLLNIGKQPLSLVFDFNQKKDLSAYISSGDFKYLDARGMEGTSCLEVTKNVVMRVPVKEHQMPVKIEFRWNLKRNRPSPNPPLFVSWGYWKGLIRFSNLIGPATYNPSSEGDYLLKDDKDWFYMTVWITKDSVDYWVNGKRVIVELFDLTDSKEIAIKFCNYSLVENLKITTVDVEFLPEINSFREFVKGESVKNRKEPFFVQNFPGRENSDWKPYFSKLSDCEPGSYDKHFGLKKK